MSGGREGGDKILFDPGMFSFMEGQVTPDAFRDVGTIIITHNHPDHVDVAALKKIVELSGAKVITNSETKDVFTKEDRGDCAGRGELSEQGLYDPRRASQPRENPCPHTATEHRLYHQR